MVIDQNGPSYRSMALERLAYAYFMGCSLGCGAGFGPTVGIRSSGHLALGWQTHAEVTMVGAELGQSYALGAPTETYLGVEILAPARLPNIHQDNPQTLIGGRFAFGTNSDPRGGRGYVTASGIYGNAERDDRTFTSYNVQLGIRVTTDGLEAFLAPSIDSFWIGPSLGNISGMCAALGTPIATPAGEAAIERLVPGDLVLSMHRGRLQAVPLRGVSRRAVRDHVMVELVLESGRTVAMSASHPTADGRTFGDLATGARLGDARVVAVHRTPYHAPFTYDILPDSDTGTYLAGGALVGSTLLSVSAVGLLADVVSVRQMVSI